MIKDFEKKCVICGGPIGKGGGGICCKEEDQFLLVHCKGHLREFQDRECNVDDVIELLYDDLAEYLETKRQEDIENYDEEMVYAELERRVLRWINLKMINFRQLSGIGFCMGCGAAIMAGRTKCAACTGAGAFGDFSKKSDTFDLPKPRGGMHFKR